MPKSPLFRKTAPPESLARHWRRSVLGAGSVFAATGVFVAMFGGKTAFAQSRETPLATPASLASAASAAQAVGEPMVLLVGLPGCPFCELIRRNYLAPMRAKDGLHAWQIQVNDAQTPLQDFAGAASSASTVATLYQARFTPTVLLLNAQGIEVAERLVGLGSPDFFGAYLEARLATARTALAGAAKTQATPSKR